MGNQVGKVQPMRPFNCCCSLLNQLWQASNRIPKIRSLPRSFDLLRQLPLIKEPPANRFFCKWCTYRRFSCRLLQASPVSTGPVSYLHICPTTMKQVCLTCIRQMYFASSNSISCAQLRTHRRFNSSVHLMTFASYCYLPTLQISLQS